MPNYRFFTPKRFTIERAFQLTSSKQPHSILSSVLHFASGTFLSRIGGLVRDLSMAFCFGVNPSIAAFFVAFRLSNILRRIFGEGALLNSFIPHFEEHRKKDPKQAALFFRDILYSLSFLLLGIIVFVEGGLASWLTSGYGSEGNRLIASLTTILFPGLLFVCLFSISSGLLQCERKFFLIGIAPLLFNIVWIASIWIYRDYPLSEATQYLSWAVTLGTMMQWILILPSVLLFLRKYLSWKECFQYSLFTKEIRASIASISLGIIGVSAAQINSGLDVVFARQASLEGPAYLNYAIHIEQLPLALFGIGFSMALFPSLARAIHDHFIYKKLLTEAVSHAVAVFIPCTVGMVVLGIPGINLLYGRGDFGQEAVQQTTLCLWGYGFGLVPMGLTLLFAPAFYAVKNYRIPTISSLLSLVINVSLNFLFVSLLQYGPASLALSTSIAAYGNLFFLSFHLHKTFSIDFFHSLVPLIGKIILCSALAAFVTFSLDLSLFSGASLGLVRAPISLPITFLEQFTQFSILGSTFTAFFFLSAWFFNINKLFQKVSTSAKTKDPEELFSKSH